MRMLLESASRALFEISKFPVTPEPVFTEESIGKITEILGPTRVAEDGYSWEIALESGSLRFTSIDLRGKYDEIYDSLPPVSMVEFIDRDYHTNRLHGIAGFTFDPANQRVSFVEEGVHERRFLEFDRQGLTAIGTVLLGCF